MIGNNIIDTSYSKFAHSWKTVAFSFILGIGLTTLFFVENPTILNENTFSSYFLRNSNSLGPFIHNKTATYLIPKVCYQSWKTKVPTELTDSTKELLRYNQLLNPDIDFQLWDDKDIDSFIQSEFPSSVYNSFKLINPSYGPARADFFRYCILFKRGGLWLDIKSAFTTADVFGNVIHSNDVSILDVRRIEFEPYRVKWNYGTYEQWCLAFAPNHPYLAYMIERMVRSISSRIDIPITSTSEGGAARYANKVKVLRITGPDAFAVAIHDAIVNHGLLHREIDFKNWVVYSKSGKENPEYKKNRIEHYLTLQEPFYLP